MEGKARETQLPADAGRPGRICPSARSRVRCAPASAGPCCQRRPTQLVRRRTPTEVKVLRRDTRGDDAPGIALELIASALAQISRHGQEPSRQALGFTSIRDPRSCRSNGSAYGASRLAVTSRTATNRWSTVWQRVTRSPYLDRGASSDAATAKRTLRYARQLQSGAPPAR